VIPVRNEEDLLPNALHALAEQQCADGSPFAHSAYEIVLLINNSVDRSAQVARHFARLYPSLRLHVVERDLRPGTAHIGYVRRLLMDEACRRARASHVSDALMLSTDADTQVAPNWIAANLAELCAGADVVGGRILINGDEIATLSTAAGTRLKLDRLYRRLVSWIESQLDPEMHDPWPRHPHHFGASLAIWPHVYERVGGVPPRRHLEDIAFYRALLRHDIRIKHSMKVRVMTSARLIGRARYGLSKTLSDWCESGPRGVNSLVESKAFLEFLFGTRRQLRSVWLEQKYDRHVAEAEIHSLAAAMDCSYSTLWNHIRNAASFGSLLEDIRFYALCRSAWPDWKRLQGLQRVVEDLLKSFLCERGRAVAVVASTRHNASANGHSASTQFVTEANPLARA